jgi:hypothetical protein
MKECPNCGRFYSDANRFCTDDGAQLVQSSISSDLLEEKQQRRIPPPPQPLPARITIVDHSDDKHRSRVIAGYVHDVSEQGMRIQTGTIETGQLNIIYDHKTAFKNKLELEVDLPDATIKLTGVAVWYKPVIEGVSWMVGVYIRDMKAADRQLYEAYLQKLIARSAVGSP